MTKFEYEHARRIIAGMEPLTKAEIRRYRELTDLYEAQAFVVDKMWPKGKDPKPGVVSAVLRIGKVHDALLRRLCNRLLRRKLLEDKQRENEAATNSP